MTNQTQSARDDLAFMKAMAADRDPLPWGFGAQLLAPGLLYAPCPLLVWSNLAGITHLPESWLPWLWVPAMALHLPICFWLARKSPSAVGPNKRLFGMAWMTMGAMTFVALCGLGLAQAQYGAPFLLAWPVIAFTLYGGTWMVIGAAHARVWHRLVAAGCFASALLCATQVGSPTQWLMLGLGVLLWIAAPGLIIMTQARASRSA